MASRVYVFPTGSLAALFVARAKTQVGDAVLLQNERATLLLGLDERKDEHLESLARYFGGLPNEEVA